MREPFDLSRPPTPAERIPSHGTQLSADGTADLDAHASLCRARRQSGADTRPCLRCRAERGCTLTPCCACMVAEPIAHPIMRPAAPVALNLWDTSADSLPETWSTDR